MSPGRLVSVWDLVLVEQINISNSQYNCLQLSWAEKCIKVQDKFITLKVQLPAALSKNCLVWAWLLPVLVRESWSQSKTGIWRQKVDSLHRCTMELLLPPGFGLGAWSVQCLTRIWLILCTRLLCKQLSVNNEKWPIVHWGLLLLLLLATIVKNYEGKAQWELLCQSNGKFANQ